MIPLRNTPHTSYMYMYVGPLNCLKVFCIVEYGKNEISTQNHGTLKAQTNLITCAKLNRLCIIECFKWVTNTRYKRAKCDKILSCCYYREQSRVGVKWADDNVDLFVMEIHIFSWATYYTYRIVQQIIYENVGHKKYFEENIFELKKPTFDYNKYIHTYVHMCAYLRTYVSLYIYI